MESKYEVINNILLLSNEDKHDVQKFLKKHLDGHIENFETRTFDAKTAKNIKLCCPYCKSMHIKKNGHRINKAGFPSQRFRCLDCDVTFNIRTKTISSSAKILFQQYQKFIECYANHLTLQRSAEICGFSVKTASLWRVKCSDNVKIHGDEIVLDELVEADETYLPVSYKGNHSKDGFTLPRPSHHHGKEKQKRGISTDKVCICCAIKPKGAVVVEVTNVGNPTIEQIHDAFDERIAKNTVMVTDKKSAYRKFSESNELNLIQVKCKRDKDKELTAEQPKKFRKYHVQHINAYHSVLKHFIYHFRGISSKYLDNYIAWCNLSKYAAENTYRSICNYVFEQNLSRECISLRRTMSKRPPISYCTRKSPSDISHLASQALSS